MTDGLERKLIEDVFNVINLIKIEKINTFKDNLNLESSGDQIKGLFEELHQFTISIYESQSKKLKKKQFKYELNDEKLKDFKFENRLDTINEKFKTKRIKLIDKIPNDNLESYLMASSVINDYYYESLNQGKWFNVPIKKRFAFGLNTLYFVSIKLYKLEKTIKDKEDNFINLVAEIINKIDYGLIYSPSFLNNLLPKIATLLHDYLIIKRPINKDYDRINLNKGHQTSHPINNQMTKIHNDQKLNKITINESKEIKRVKSIGLNDFYKNYFIKKIPVIIEDVINDWPAVQNWNLNFILNKAAYRLVPVEIGSRYTDENWTQSVISLKEFIDKFIIDKNNNQKGYLAQYELFDRIEQLSNDFHIPDYCALSNKCEEDYVNNLSDQEDVHINSWFGPKNTISPLHTDPKDNLLAQVFGSKYIRLYSSNLPVENLYLYDSNLLNNTSQVDVENIDLIKFPKFPKDNFQEAVLKKGELLYIPEATWHYVRSLETSFSISFWWK